MLLQLHYAGVLSKQKALILGDFSNYRLTSYDQDYDLLAMRRYIQDILPIPVISGFPFGHIAHKLTVPIGMPATLCVKGKHADLSWPARSA
jgi:muramoyltetrapeptide carboxypeptidase